MNSRVQSLLVGICLLCATAPAAAWSPATRVRMTDEAVRFMPRSLRLALETHRDALLRGMLEPMLNEDGLEHRPPWADGSLEKQIPGAARGLVEQLGETTAFDDIARSFGVLAHYALDAGYPPGMEAGSADRYEHFAAFCEERSEKFPLVFYGHTNAALDRGDYQAYALAMMERARDENHQLTRTYDIAGTPPDPTYFDDRSVAFAVGSLSYSRGVTDIVRLWLHAWREAGGDVGFTPYSDR